MPGRRIADIRRSIGEQTGEIRALPGDVVDNITPELERFNVGGGVGVGALGAGILTILEDTVGVPFGSSTDLIDIRTDGDDLIYEIDVNAPTQNIAEARAVIDSGTGFSSFITDEFDIEDAEVVSRRVARDTYRIEVRITP